MTSNGNPPPFGDPLQEDKMLSSVAALLPHRNAPAQSVPMHSGESATGPPTPTNWQAQQRAMQGPTQFDFNPQSARTRFREHPLHSVPGAFPPEAYANNGQASFAGGQHAQIQPPTNTPRGGHRGGGSRSGPSSAQSAHDRAAFKGAHVSSATYDGPTTPVSGSSNTGVSAPMRGNGRGSLVKSNTFNNAVDSSVTVPYNVAASASGSEGADSGAYYNAPANASRDRQFATGGRNANGRANSNSGNANAGWTNATWTNQNNNAQQSWPNQAGAQAQQWIAGQNATAQNWSNQAAATGGASHANWQGYSHGHGNAGHGHRGSNRSARPSRGGGLIAVSAMQNASGSQPGVGVGVNTGGATDMTGSSSPNGSNSTDGQSSACGAESVSERAFADSRRSDNSSSRRRSTPPPPGSSAASTRRSANSASASPTSVGIGVASTPDSAAAHPQAAEWQSTSSSPVTSGVATPTRSNTTNEYGLTFGEYTPEIESIVNSNRATPSTGVSISLNASAATAAASATTDGSDLTPRSQAFSTAGGAADPNSSESRSSTSASAHHVKQNKQPDSASSSVERRKEPTAARASSSPQTLLIAYELERLFEELQTKAARAHKSVTRYTPEHTCFHQHAKSTSNASAEPTADAASSRSSTSTLPKS